MRGCQAGRHLCNEAGRIAVPACMPGCGGNSEALAAGDKRGKSAACPSRQMLKEMNAVKKNYASRIATLAQAASAISCSTIQKEERPQLLSRLVRLSQRDLYCRAVYHRKVPAAGMLSWE